MPLSFCSFECMAPRRVPKERSRRRLPPRAAPLTVCSQPKRRSDNPCLKSSSLSRFVLSLCEQFNKLIIDIYSNGLAIMAALMLLMFAEERLPILARVSSRVGRVKYNLLSKCLCLIIFFNRLMHLLERGAAALNCHWLVYKLHSSIASSASFPTVR